MSTSVDEVIMIPPEKRVKHDNEDSLNLVSVESLIVTSTTLQVLSLVPDLREIKFPTLSKVNITTGYSSSFNLKQVEESVKGVKNISYCSQLVACASSAAPPSAAESASAAAPASSAKMATIVDNSDSTTLWPDLKPTLLLLVKRSGKIILRHMTKHLNFKRKAWAQAWGKIVEASSSHVTGDHSLTKCVVALEEIFTPIFNSIADWQVLTDFTE
ncbi:hypothetical protein P8452_38456 [Trifolium repens]|nr:hypothetical protein P8452_38456 [Trifolium repens]